MNIIKNILIKNPCYTSGHKLAAVKGLMIHSVGCPQPNAMVFIKNWNSPQYKNACVHAFIDGKTGNIYQCLPWNHRGWHAGGSANNTHIGVEMCEPNTIKYTGGSNWIETGDGTNTKAIVMRTYNSAVELFAFLCEKYNLNPLQDGVIISHCEGYYRGVASGHGDPEHIWKKYGLSMDGFRKAIAAKMNKTVIPDTTKNVNYQCEITANTLNIRSTADTSTNTNIIGSYKLGDVVTITKENNNGWGYTGKGWISLSYIEKIPTQSNAKQEDEEMTQDKFNQMFLTAMNTWRGEHQDNDAGEWSKEAREWAVANGIITGASSNNFNGMWEDMLTREQMAAILYRFAKLMGKA